MIQAELNIDGGDEGNDSLVRSPRTSRHFVSSDTRILPGSGQRPHTETTMICKKCGDVSTIFLECGDRTCFECQKRRKKRILKRYRPIVTAMHNPQFLTLTLKRCKLTSDRVKDIRKYFTKLRHRDVWTVEGGIYQIEVGKIVNGTANLHIHAIIDTIVWMDEVNLANAWYDITGDSWIVDIRNCWSPRGALGYLTYHMGKRIGTYQDADLINAVLKNTRLVQGFGYLSDMNLSILDTICLKCGGKNTLYMDFEVSNYQYPAKVHGF